ncbi:hypothetical protein MSG28_014040 [Choristoneura fumiferana]|uniref:Uncharacterized protein n=1 Tax=Choristoneura fumiferana TaxID=7141 RepID=A0ACC0JFS1_CHOFU|nr:hypothetical protein MSG28_014040 [Choristoneura fumiferana]
MNSTRNEVFEPPAPPYSNLTVRRAFIVWLHCGQTNKFKDVCNYYHVLEKMEARGQNGIDKVPRPAPLTPMRPCATHTLHYSTRARRPVARPPRGRNELARNMSSSPCYMAYPLICTRTHTHVVYGSAGSRWMQAAASRSNWWSMGEAYVQQWTSYG